MATTTLPGRESSSAEFHARFPAGAMTLADFRAWVTAPTFPAHLRAAFIEHEIHLEISNEDPNTHARVKGEIFRGVANLIKETESGLVFPDGVLVSNEEGEVSNNPDAGYAEWESFEEGRVELMPRENEEDRFKDLRGTPDWVLEVVSDSSVEKDTRQLRNAYHRAGIPEYWLVDARGADIVFKILIHRKKGYVAAAVHDGWQKSRVFNREFRLTRRRTRLNLWEYTLEMR